MGPLRKHLDRAIAAAATLTGKRFALLVASSIVATSAIVAAAVATPGSDSPLAALLGRSLASSQTPVAAAPAPEPRPAGSGGGSGSPASPSGAEPESFAPVESPAPVESSEEEAPEPEAEETTPTVPAATTPEAGQVKHVFVVSLTSPGYEAAFGAASQMPYLADTLRPQGQLLSGYQLLGNAGLPNRIATISGQPPNAATKGDCSTYAEFPAGSKLNAKGVVSGSGCVHPVETLTLADQLVGARFTWRGYFEGMVDPTGKPDNCIRPEAEGADQPLPGAYAAARNPFVYFHSLLDLGDCSENDLPLTELEADLRKPDSTAGFSYISPSPCNAGRAGQCPPGSTDGAAAADAFLAVWVPKILASPAYKKDGLLIVAFDEASPEAIATEPVGALLLSKFVAPGATDPSEYTPYSLLRSTEDLFGLFHLGAAGNARVKSFGESLRGGEAGTGD